ncbi:MAG: MYXO-CTERM sorting domain-containing protein [Myxococcota bacterium]
MVVWWIGLGAVSFAVDTGVADTGAPLAETASDTGVGGMPAVSAAQLAGEEGGCRCTSVGDPSLRPSLTLSLALVLAVASRRRRR